VWLISDEPFVTSASPLTRWWLPVLSIGGVVALYLLVG